MGKEEFMSRLNSLLKDLPTDERVEALQYYEGYFNDAGPGREEEVVLELGSPEALSLAIHEEITGQRAVHDVEGEFTEQGFRDAEYYENLEYPEHPQNRANQNSRYTEYSTDGRMAQENRDFSRGWGNPNDENYGWASKNVHQPPRTGGQILFIILACLFILPVVVPAAIGLGIGLLGLVAGLWVGGVACLASSIAVVGFGIVRLFTSVATGVLAIGGGFVVFGLGLLLIEGGIWSSKGVGALFHGTRSLLRRIFSREETYWEPRETNPYREQ